MADKTINTLWFDFRDFMYTLDIEHHAQAVWDWLETEDLFVDDADIQEKYDAAYADGYNDAKDEWECDCDG